MKNIIFLMAMVCLLAGCGENTVMKVKTEADVTAKQALPVKVETGRTPLLIKIADKPALLLLAIVAIATVSAAFAAWRAAESTKRTAKELLEIFKTNLKK